MGEAVGFAAEFLPRPHLTPTLWPSMSIPFAQASAARSAESRSLKLMNAHLENLLVSWDTNPFDTCENSLGLCDMYD